MVNACGLKVWLKDVEDALQSETIRNTDIHLFNIAENVRFFIHFNGQLAMINGFSKKQGR